MRLFGDLVIAAFFEESQPKKRKAKRDEYAGAVFTGELKGYRDSMQQRRRANPALAPFHWEIEFPEVFEGATSPTTGQGSALSGQSRAFHAIVGNPPFAGKNSLAAGNVAEYSDWLKQFHPESHGNADLVAYFFRRAFDLIRKMGVFGLIATNTIAQGDTRASGLRWICKHGGEIFSVRRRVKWPGLAAVVVSVIHVGKGPVSDRKQIDDQDVERITAFLFHRGGHDDPARLAENAGKSFQGSIVLGMGFTFDDTDTKGVASPLAEMRRLVVDPRNREVISPYIGGQEINTSPTHAHHRYVINFRDWPLRRVDVCDVAGRAAGAASMFGESAGRLQQPATRPQRRGGASTSGESPGGGCDHAGTIAAGGAYKPGSSGISVAAEGPPAPSWVAVTEEQRRACLRRGLVPLDYPGPVAADWPDLLQIVEGRVKPERAKLGDNGDARRRKKKWWLWGRYTPALFAAIAGLDRVLAISQTSKTLAFAFLPPDWVYSHKVVVFPYATHGAFSVLQARLHEIWARFFGSTLKDDAVYTPSDCFETFPFPAGWESDLALEVAGRDYYDFRGRLMVHNDEGLTKTCNRFNDPNENDPDIVTLRDLHATMDRAVLDPYGWRDIPTDCEFLLDREIDEEEWDARKKLYRHRWPDDVRDEVLARLLELNAERAAAENHAGCCSSNVGAGATGRHDEWGEDRP